ncbi:hypothetical protein ACGFIR_30375 [Micromonospora sp. NPDC049051]|uniref:hypothetical protein n=1 Tax=Micromonospora sp. NPDC049051 TaxID=3364264 RepID=UPI003714E313
MQPGAAALRAKPMMIFSGRALTYVTTRDPFGVVALCRSATGDCALAWAAALPNVVADPAEVGDRIAVTTPAGGRRPAARRGQP